MLHSKFQTPQSIGSGEEDLYMFSPYMLAIVVKLPG